MRCYTGPNKSAFGTPVLFASINGGQMRTCINYRTLNRVTVKKKIIAEGRQPFR